MLQQTQVDRVVPKYTSSSIATPPWRRWRLRPNDVKRLWYPLGYNVRPLNLHGIACEAVATYGGRLPDDDEALRAMRGIGRYNRRCGALLRLRAAGCDSRHHVRRVLRPVFLGPGAWRGCAGRRRCGTWPARWLPPRKAYDYNQALRTSAPPGHPAGASLQPLRCGRSCATYRAERRGRGGAMAPLRVSRDVAVAAPARRAVALLLRARGRRAWRLRPAAGSRCGSASAGHRNAGGGHAEPATWAEAT